MKHLFAVAVVLTAGRTLTFSVPDSVLLFGDYGELQVATPERVDVLHPPVDEGYNGGYFALPSVARDGSIAWAFAVAWQQERHSPRFALGVYSRARQEWRTYGEFNMLGDAAITPDGARIAAVAEDHGRLTLQILDVASGRLTNGPYHRGMWPRASPSWSPDATQLAVQVHRPDESSFVAVLDIKSGELRSLADGGSPHWSPDGQWIAFHSGRDCKLIRPDGTGQKTVFHLKDSLMATRRFGWGSPVWSPDSRQLLLNVLKNDGPFDVVLLDLATSHTTTKSKSGWPVFGWVPDRAASAK